MATKSSSKARVPAGLPGSPQFKPLPPNPGSGPVKRNETALPPNTLERMATSKPVIGKPVVATPPEPTDANYPESTDPAEFDPFGDNSDELVVPDYVPPTPRAARSPVTTVPTGTQPLDVFGYKRESGAKVFEFLETRVPITLELADTMLMVKAVAMIETPYSVTLLIPVTKDGFTFVPKPGSSVTVLTNNSRIECYFPGTSFELADLGVLGLSFVKASIGGTE